MSKLDWCKEKKGGIKIVEPNENLAKSYMQKSDDSLMMMEDAPSEDWRIVGAYYACYQALYSLLRKAGIKCEIHDCTIELTKFLHFSEEEIEFVKELKEKRENAQYHVTERTKLEDTDRVKEFVLKCKKILEERDFSEIRNEITSRLD